MGRELQKKKNRSSKPRVTMKPKSKKRILSNSVVAANWDKGQTLAQNYRRLGLRIKLNAPSGGMETHLLRDESSKGASALLETDPLALPSAPMRQGVLVPEEVRIERDATTGAILRVLDASLKGVEAKTSATARRRKPLQDPLSALLDDDDANHEGLTAHAPQGLVPKPSNHPTTDVVAALERMAANEQGRRGKSRRTQSYREQAWARALFENHGRNWMAMVKDAKLNVRQQSEGDVRKRVGLWLKESGQDI